MKLSTEGLKNQQEWLEKGYHLPQYDRAAMIAETRENPVWVHFGAGNIFRAFQANLAQRLLEEGAAKAGITVCEGFDYEIVEKQYRPHDDLSVLVTLKADGTIEKSVIGSIGESTILDSENDAEYSRLKEIFSKDSLQLCTFTVTEKGYSLVNGKGEELPAVTADFAAGLYFFDSERTMPCLPCTRTRNSAMMFSVFSRKKYGRGLRSRRIFITSVFRDLTFSFITSLFHGGRFRSMEIICTI